MGAECLPQPVGRLHGDMQASIAEALASLGDERRRRPEGKIGLGKSNHASLLRPKSEGTIYAVARRRHRGRTTWIWDVELSDDEGRLCALSRVTIAVAIRQPDGVPKTGEPGLRLVLLARSGNAIRS